MRGGEISGCQGLGRRGRAERGELGICRAVEPPSVTPSGGHVTLALVKTHKNLQHQERTST